MTDSDMTDRPPHADADVSPLDDAGKPRRKRKAAAPGSVVPSTEVTAETAEAAPEAVPMMGSTLVGDGTDGLTAAKARPRDDTPPDLTTPLAGEVPDMAASNDAPPDLSAPVDGPVARPDEAPKAVTSAAPSPAHAVARPEPRRGGFLPLVLGGVIAAGLGSAATIWAMPQLGGGDPGLSREEIEAVAREAAAGREGAVIAQAEEAARAVAAAALADLPAPVAAPAPVATVPPPPIDLTASLLPAPVSGPDPEVVAALERMIADQATRLEDQAVRLEDQAARIEELAARPVLDPEQVDRVEALTERAEALEDQIQSTAEEAQATITEAQGAAERLRAEAEESTRRAEAVAAVAALRAALDQGVSTEAAVDGLEQAGVAAPEALRGEVPTLPALQEEYDGAARAALRAALPVEREAEGAVGVIGNFLRAQTGARSVTAREGTDADAVLSRAGAAVTAGDIDTALTEIAALPEAARTAPAMAEWLSRAEAWRAARGAVEALTEGEPASAETATDAPAAPTN